MGERNRRSNYIQQSGVRGIAAWILMLIFLIKMIYMSYKNGMIGMTYYALADSVFLICYLLLGIAVVPILKKMIYFQINHGSYRNAAKVYRVISGSVMFFAAAAAVVMFLLSEQISVLLFGTKLCSLLLKLLAAALVFQIAASCLKAYMEGLGNAMPGIVAELLAHGIGLVITILFQPMFAGYGRKVAALMRQDSYAYAYAVCSGALGLAVGAMAACLFLLAVNAFFGREVKKRIHRDEIKKTDSAQDIIRNFSISYITTAFVDHIGTILAAVLIILYCHTTGNTENGAGMLFCGCILLVLPPALLAMQIALPFTKQLTSIMKQADFHHAKERMSFSLKLLSYSILPYVVSGFAVAPLLAQVLFDAESAECTAIIRIGMLIGLLMVYGIFFRQVLSVLVKPYVRNLYAGLLGISGIVFYVIFERTSMKAEECVAYAYMMACLLYLLVVCFVILKKIRIYNRLLDCVVMPFVSALLAGAVSFGLFILMDGKLPAWILFMICAVITYALHNVVIAVFRVFEAHEWSQIPASGFPVSVAKLTGRY